MDAYGLAWAAKSALRSPNPNKRPSTEGWGFVENPVDPAAHFFYFFDSSKEVADYVDAVFDHIIDCEEGANCSPVQLVGCAGDEPGPECTNGAWGYVRPAAADPADPAGTAKPKAEAFMCDTGLKLPDNADVCTSEAGGVTKGYALLYQLVQVPDIVGVNATYLEEKTGFTSIGEVNGPESFEDSLADIGWGRGGTGLKGKGLANAKNYAAFAQWSLDLGYGSFQVEKCTEKWDAAVQAQGLDAVGRNLLELEP